MDAWPIELWNQWATQILVLLSFTLQVVLLVLAGIRRHNKAPAVLRFPLWLAYQLADSTATYGLAHFSLSSTPHDDQLVAFWAPFLLLHLGGPDNITAYALEDNKLWQRHLVTLVVQVLWVAYVIYKHIAGGRILLLAAAILMFAAGFLKYGERTWALKHGNIESIRSSLRKNPPAKHYVYSEYDHIDLSQAEELGSDLHEEEEVLLRRAHSIFHICQRAVVDSSVDVDPDPRDSWLVRHGWKTMWRLVEMELSLLYDILYTKATVMHTWSGYSIRVFTLVAAVSSFLLFWFSANGGGRHNYSQVDVAITYVLLAGAFLLELTSLLGAIGSSWMLAFLYSTRWSWLRHAALCSGRWDWFRRKAVSLRRFFVFNVASYGSRQWSGTMGQYNILRFCSRGTRSARFMEVLGLEQWWSMKHYSWTVHISDHVKELLHRHVRNVTLAIIGKRWGKNSLKNHADLRSFLGKELSEDILVWHIATDIFLVCRSRRAEDDYKTLITIEEISNYMMFLLVKHPYMLPGLVLNRIYQLTCDDMAKVWRARRDNGGSNRPSDDDNRPHEANREKLARVLLHKYKNPDSQITSYWPENRRLLSAIKLAQILLEKKDDNILEVVLQVWMEILFYAAKRCSGESHAKKISSGPELTTVQWLILENYLHYLRTKKLISPI